jgi:nitrous oxidase accessory protein
MIRASLLAALVAAGGPECLADTLVAGPGRAWPCIREALRAAAPGDTIQVEGGVHVGNLLLDKTIKLEGAGRPVIRGDGVGSVITVTANSCTIRGFVIERSGGMLVDEDSGILLKSGGNRIEDNELRDVLYGIYLYRSDGNTVGSNVIRGRPLAGLGERGSGIHIWDSSHNTIEGNTISQVRDGMYLQNAHWSGIRRNRAFDLRYGLHYMFSNDNWFEDNVLHDNVAGAAIMYSRRIRFRGNVFLRNRGFSSFGVLFQDTYDCLAAHNLIADNAVGIFMEALRSSVFHHNLVAANDIAIQAFSNATGNVFHHNNFIHNLSPIHVVGRATGIRWSESGAGNYWSDYEGYDLDGDGAGDAPHRIQNLFERLEGNYPRLRLYFFSPASQALAFAERAFPVIEASREIDFAPLMKPVEAPFRGFREDEIQEMRSFWVAVPALMLVLSAAIMAKGRRR